MSCCPSPGHFPPRVNSRGGGKDSSVESGTREVAPGNICEVQEDLALVCDRCQQRDAGRTDLRGRQNESGIFSRRQKDGFFFKKRSKVKERLNSSIFPDDESGSEGSVTIVESSFIP